MELYPRPGSIRVVLRAGNSSSTELSDLNFYFFSCHWNAPVSVNIFQARIYETV